MLNYIRAELYRSFKRPSFRNSTIIIIVLALAFSFMFSLSGTQNFIEALTFISLYMSLPLIFIIIYIEIVTGIDLRDHTIKNSMELGLAREEIVIGKLISSAILGLIACIAVLASYVIATFLIFQYPGSTVALRELYRLLILILAEIPIWFAGIAIASYFSFRGIESFKAGFYYVAVIQLIPNMLAILARIKNWDRILKLKKFLSITDAVTNISGSLGYRELVNPLKTIGYGWLVGAIYVGVFGYLSIRTFRKKDI